MVALAGRASALAVSCPTFSKDELGLDHLDSKLPGLREMNCHNCSAPLNWDGYQPIIVCEHCHTFRSLGTPDDSSDRVVLLNRPGNTNCPRCRRRLMQAAMDGLQVEHCEDCQGVLVVDEVFALLVRNRRAEYRGAASHPIPLDPQQLQVRTPCPSCRRTMDVHPYYGPGNVVIDSCCRCGLIWLDCGEMATIEVAPGRR